MSFYPKARPDGRWAAYDHADTIADAATAYRRCRTGKSFILADDSPDLALPCSACGTAVNDYGDTPRGYRGNRCEYNPRSKRFRLMHYTCSWGALLGGIGTSYDLAEAAAKVESLGGEWTDLNRKETTTNGS